MKVTTIVRLSYLKGCKYKVKVLVYFAIFPHACAFHNLGFWNQFDDVVPMLTRSITNDVELHIHSVDVISDELQVLLVGDSSNPTDFGIQINKSIADIREPESRSSDWTKTFTLPGTKTNNKLFTHLFDLNLSIRNTTSTNFSPDFNPNLKADALLTVDEVTQIEGFIRLLSIKVNDLNQIEYECSMHGELADLFAKISDAKLEELDFTEYNHVLNATNISSIFNFKMIYTRYSIVFFYCFFA